jgi:hypothetical protein
MAQPPDSPKMMSVVRMRPSVSCVNPWGTACWSASVMCLEVVYGHRLSGKLSHRVQVVWILDRANRRTDPANATPCAPAPTISRSQGALSVIDVDHSSAAEFGSFPWQRIALQLPSHNLLRDLDKEIVLADIAHGPTLAWRGARGHARVSKAQLCSFSEDQQMS